MGKSMNSRVVLQAFESLADPPSERRERIRAWWMDWLASCLNPTAMAPRTAKTDGETHGARLWEARSILFSHGSAFARLRRDK